ncbi:hypothetical protein IWX48DRAFT_656536 [Phyllosticta citricarpa]
MAYSTLVRRDGGFSLTPAMTKLLIALLVLVLVAFLSVIALFMLRRARNAKKQSELPMYNEHDPNAKDLMNEARSPDSPIPEIRITFPEEVDDKGSKQPGRVVVVRVGEHSVGLEPVQDEQLPPYQKDENDRFVSLDLERIGGLKEKTNAKNEYSI